METRVDVAAKEQQDHSAFACDTCKSDYGHDEAKILTWTCCGHEMTRLEVLYRSEPSPFGA
ncbi:MAG: hypothetical protein GWN41_06940, partial [Phycisphaerae bacterium]|nr:hypothetical protein [Phycisphaerae bacterium]